MINQGGGLEGIVSTDDILDLLAEEITELAKVAPREQAREARTRIKKGDTLMQRPLQIVFRDMDPSDAVETAIREKAEKLGLFYPHIIGCKATVEIAGKHKHQGKLFKVRLDISVPGGELVVNRDKHEEFYVALRDAFDAAKRQLEDYGQRQRGAVKSHQVEPD